MSQAAASLLGVTTGDTLRLVSRLDESRTRDVAISGAVAARPRRPVVGGRPARAHRERGRRLASRPAARSSSPPRTSWRGRSQPLDAAVAGDPRRRRASRPATSTRSRRSRAGAQDRVNAALPFSNRAQVLTRLPTILAAVDRSVLVTQPGSCCCSSSSACSPAYAIILVAALLLERRRTETALLRARGGGFGHLVSMAAGEALLITVPAVIAAPWARRSSSWPSGSTPRSKASGSRRRCRDRRRSRSRSSAARSRSSPSRSRRSLSGATSPASGPRSAAGRPDAAAAAGARPRARACGGHRARPAAPVRRADHPNARGALGVDPLLVAAPAIGLLAGAVIAIRFVPRLAELAERVLARGRGSCRRSPGGRSHAGRSATPGPRCCSSSPPRSGHSPLRTPRRGPAARATRPRTLRAPTSASRPIRRAPSRPWGLGECAPGHARRHGGDAGRGRSIQLGTTLRDGALLGIDGAAMADIVRVRDDETGRGDAACAARARVDARRARTRHPDPEGTRRISLVADSAFEPIEGSLPFPDDETGLGFALLVLDADGRIARLPGNAGAARPGWRAPRRPAHRSRRRRACAAGVDRRHPARRHAGWQPRGRGVGDRRRQGARGEHRRRR